MTSELSTKKGLSSFPRIFSASFRGPAVPRGSVSTENVMLMLYSCSYCEMFCQLESSDGVRPVQADLLESCCHDLWSVVDSKHDICDASGCEGFNLM